jgi:hypothetical protein
MTSPDPRVSTVVIEHSHVTVAFEYGTAPADVQGLRDQLLQLPDVGEIEVTQRVFRTVLCVRPINRSALAELRTTLTERLQPYATRAVDYYFGSVALPNQGTEEITCVGLTFSEPQADISNVAALLAMHIAEHIGDPCVLYVRPRVVVLTITERGRREVTDRTLMDALFHAGLLPQMLYPMVGGTINVTDFTATLRSKVGDI